VVILAAHTWCELRCVRTLHKWRQGSWQFTVCFIPSTTMNRTGSRTVKEQSRTSQQIVSSMKTSSEPSLLMCCGPRSSKWSRTQDPNTVSVDQLENWSLQPKPTVTVQRCPFTSHTWQQGQ